jgi:hypothetical protein
LASLLWVAAEARIKITASKKMKNMRRRKTRRRRPIRGACSSLPLEEGVRRKMGEAAEQK